MVRLIQIGVAGVIVFIFFATQADGSGCRTTKPTPVPEPPALVPAVPEPVPAVPVVPEPVPVVPEPVPVVPEPVPVVPEPVPAPPEPVVPTPAPAKPAITCAYLERVGAGPKWFKRYGCVQTTDCKKLRIAIRNGAGKRWVKLARARGCIPPPPMVRIPVTG